MNRFNLYATYYDLLYKDKDYQSEIEYVLKLANTHSPNSILKILDLGCGTGIHANLLSEQGCQVDGVDTSEMMIKQAIKTFGNNSSINFYVDNITKFIKNKHYDLVTSLFHVISYQNSNEDLLNSFRTANRHLDTNGLFVFDFWYGPGVLTELPEERIKELENDSIVVKRRAKPELFVNDNVVDVNYDIDILEKTTSLTEKIKEKHSMRYFFIKELVFYLENSGFKMIDYFKWMTFEKPTTNTWNVVVVAKKQ